MELVTQVNSRFISQFVVKIDDDFSAPNLDDFINYIKEYVEGGAHFETGQLFQYLGFSLKCTVCNGNLSFSVPDLEGTSPEDLETKTILWTDNLTFVLSRSLEHIYVPESFGFEPSFPSLEQTALVVKGFEHMPMSMNRLEPDKDWEEDSGWGFATADPSVDHQSDDSVSVMTLWEVAVLAPHVLPFLSMPVGTLVGFTDNKIYVFYNDKPIEPHPDSFVNLTMHESLST